MAGKRVVLFFVLVMVVAAALPHALSSSLHGTRHFCCNPFSPLPPSVLILRRSRVKPKRSGNPNPGPSGAVSTTRAYMDDTNSVSGFANRVIGSLPIVGLVARIFTDEGGVGGDLLDFAEFRRRIGKRCSFNDSRAFVEFQKRRGKKGDPIHMLFCCWLAAVGAGLLKSEEILNGVARLRISNDIEFEEQTFIFMMNEAKERRMKLKVANPSVPMEVRAEKALDAIYICCFGKDPIEDEDEQLLSIMLSAVFPSVGHPEMKKIVQVKRRKLEDGSDESLIMEPKPLTKEAIQQQMKDLQFLRQNSDS